MIDSLSEKILEILRQHPKEALNPQEIQEKFKDQKPELKQIAFRLVDLHHVHNKLIVCRTFNDIFYRIKRDM